MTHDTEGRRALSAWRAGLGMTQQEVATLALRRGGWGLDQPTFSAWESGARLPSGLARVLLYQLTLGVVRPEMWEVRL